MNTMKGVYAYSEKKEEKIKQKMITPEQLEIARLEINQSKLSIDTTIRRINKTLA